MLLAGGAEEAERLNNVQELISNAIEFEKTHSEDNANLETFLEEAALISDIDNYDDENNAVVLMTIHSAKGLEFPVVFLPGVEEGLFPGMQATVFPEELEEERRLAYVAIRGQRKSFIAYTSENALIFGRTQFNQLSRFINEIPSECIEIDEEKKPTVPSHHQAKQRKNIISKEFFTQPALKATVGNKSFEHFKIGDKVCHLTFGEGIITAAREMGTDVLYEIAFDDVGTKKLMAIFAKLKRSAE